MQGLAVVLQHDFSTGADLGFGEDLEFFEQADILFSLEVGEGFRGGLEIQKAAFFGLFDPLLRVVVAVEEDALVLLDGLFDELVEGGVEVLGALQHVRKLRELLGHRGVQHDIGPGDGEGGAQHPEFEFVAGKGKGRGPVAVGGVLGEVGEDIHADLQIFLGPFVVSRRFFDTL